MKYIFNIFFTVLTLISVAAWRVALADNVAYKSKPSREEFRRSIEAHRDRVYTGAFVVINEFYNRFDNFILNAPPKEIILQMAERYFRLHDLPKTFDMAQLRAHQYAGDQTIFECLYRVYGREIEPKCKKELNRIEDEIKMKLMTEEFSSISNLSDIISDFKKIERMLDIVEVKLYRTKEMGIKRSKNDIEILVAKAGDPLMDEIVLWVLARIESNRKRSIRVLSDQYCLKALLDL